MRYFTRAEDLRAWITNAGSATHPPTLPARYPLTDPRLTGMNCEALHTLLQELIVPYAAAIEERRHRQRGGDRRLGTRAGVFRQKITDSDRILATILYQRRLCGLNTLAELFDVCRSTLWNAINDVLPILDDRRITIAPAEHRYATTVDLLASVEQPSTATHGAGNQQVVS